MYTASNSYQHMVYEFVIPLLAIGTNLAKNIKIAFEAYGTMAPPPPPTVSLPVCVPDHVDPVDPDNPDETETSEKEK